MDSSAEHLGHCIYDGIWVGEDSPIPNTRGIRNDVVAALKQLKVPVVRWPGRLFRGRIPLGRRHRPARGAPQNDQYPLGRRGRNQRLRHARVHGLLRADWRRSRTSAATLGSGTRGRDDAVGRIHDVRRRQPDGQFAPEKRPRKTVETEILRRRQRIVGLRRQHDAGVLRQRIPPLQHLH